MMGTEVIKIKRRKMVINFSRGVQFFPHLRLDITFACVADELTNLFKYFSHVSFFSPRIIAISLTLFIIVVAIINSK